MRFRSHFRRNPTHDLGDLDVDPIDAAVAPDVLPARAPDGMRRRSYDPAFEPAVAQGLLTVQAAWARGGREAYVVGLQHRYELTPTLAYEVADNSLTLLEALDILDRQNDGALPELTGTRSLQYRRLVPLVLVFVGALLFLGQFGERLWNEQGRVARGLEQLSFAVSSRLETSTVGRVLPEARAIRSKVERDEQGRITLVSGRKPSAVVEEICRLASSTGSCAWMEVRPMKPGHPGLRLGRFAAAPDDSERWSVLIRRNRSSGRWFAGTGLKPLQPFPEVLVARGSDPDHS
jgi:hypothetical protein